MKLKKESTEGTENPTLERSESKDIENEAVCMLVLSHRLIHRGGRDCINGSRKKSPQ
jgi:hypothetical protein